VKGVREFASVAHCLCPSSFDSWVEQRLGSGQVPSKGRRFLEDVLGIVPNCECLCSVAPDAVVVTVVSFLDQSDVTSSFAAVSRQFCSISLCHPNAFRGTFIVWQCAAHEALQEALVKFHRPMDEVAAHYSVDDGLIFHPLLIGFGHVRQARSFLRCCTPMLPILTDHCNGCKKFLSLIANLAKCIQQSEGIVDSAQGSNRCTRTPAHAQLHLVRPLITELIRRVTLLISGIQKLAVMIPGPAFPTSWTTWYEEFRGSAGVEFQIFELARDLWDSLTTARSIFQNLNNVSMEILQYSRSLALWASRQ